MNRVKEDAMNGAACEDEATTEWRIVTDVDRFCGAKKGKFFFAPKLCAITSHVIGDVIFI
jgi:hypothetical protein